MKKSRKAEKWAGILQMLIVPVLLVAFWEIAGRNGWIKTTAISIPSRIWGKAVEMIRAGTLQGHILISFKRILSGFVCGALLGIVFGVFLGAFPMANRFLRLILDLLRPIPIIVWVPVLILWIGIGESTKIIVIAIGTFWPVFLNVLDGVTNVDQKYLEVATVFTKKKTETVYQVIFPATVPYLVAGIRIASGNALMGVVGAEMFAASSGLGYMVTFYREMNQPASMMVGVIVIALLGAVINGVIQLLKKREKA